MTSFKVILTLTSVLFSQILHSSSDYVPIELNTVDNSKCGAENGWSSVDMDTLPYALNGHDKKVLKASSFSCASFPLKVSPTTLEISVYIEAFYDSKVEILVRDNDKSILNYVYDKSNVDFEQGWHTITLFIDKETTAYVTLLGFSQEEDTVIVESIKYNDISLADSKTDWTRQKDEIKIIDLLSYKNDNLNYEDHRSGLFDDKRQNLKDERLGTTMNFYDEDHFFNNRQDYKNVIVDNPYTGTTESLDFDDDGYMRQDSIDDNYHNLRTTESDHRSGLFDDLRQNEKDESLGTTIDFENFYEDRLLDTRQDYKNIIVDNSNTGTTESLDFDYDGYMRQNSIDDNYHNLRMTEDLDNFDDKVQLLDLKQDHETFIDEYLDLGTTQNLDQDRLLDTGPAYHKIFDENARLSTIQYLENLYDDVDMKQIYEKLVDPAHLLNQPTKIEITKRKIKENQDVQTLSIYNNTGEGKGQIQDTNSLLKKDADIVITSLDRISAQGKNKYAYDVEETIDNEIEEEDNEGAVEENGDENGNEGGNNENEGEENEVEEGVETGDNGEENEVEGDETGDNGEENGEIENEEEENEVEGGETGDNGENENEEEENEVEGGETGGNGEENGENENEEEENVVEGGETGDNGEENGENENEEEENEVEGGETGGNGEDNGGENGNEDEDNGVEGDNGEENGENEEQDNGNGENNGNGSNNESDNDSSFWNIWTITLVSVASGTLIGVVVVSAYYLGKNSGGRATSPIDLSDLEAPRIIPRAKTTRPPYERFGSEYGGSGLGRE